MQTSSNVLVVGPPRAVGDDFGADFVGDLAAARTYLERRKPAVLVFGAGRTRAEFDDFCAFAMHTSPESLWIVASEGVTPSTLIHWTNHGRLHDLVNSLTDPDLGEVLQQALEASGENSQRRQLVGLFEDQSLQLHRLTEDLEARVQKRHRQLRKSLRRLDETRVNIQSFHKALLGIHRASTVSAMEQALNEALREAIHLDWARIRFSAQTSLAQTAKNVLAIDLPLNLSGQVLFAKAEGEHFRPDESDFLYELTEALALALTQLRALEQAEVLKGQWQATFDAIPHPLCLVAGDFEILKLNRAFGEATGGELRALIGKKCFRAFFTEDEFNPPENLESPFSFRNSRHGTSGSTEHYEVSGQRLGMTLDNQTVQLILLRNITEEVRFERRLLDASKLAELGTIGSSIAHELNNPLGGMLSFLQLILMDLKKSDPIYEDVRAMEQATLRCRDIVQNLLSFARKQDLGDFTRTNICDVIETAVKLIELQSKSKGIELTFTGHGPVFVNGSANGLSQALCNLLQNALDAIDERLRIAPAYHGQVSISVEAAENANCVVRVTDNGTGIRPEVQSQIFNPLFTTRDPGRYGGMGLTSAFAIISEHHGKLEILSQTGSGTTAIVTLPRLDESLESRNLDDANLTPPKQKLYY